jgi:antirestriction protein ArdC
VSFKQAQQLGGRVKAGERGFPCVFWKIWKDKEVGPTGEEKETRRMILRYYTVFNVEQTTGLEKKIPQPEVLRETKTIDACEEMIKGMPNRPDINHGGDRACYNLVSDKVSMPSRETFVSDEHYYSVLFHELTHSTGSKSRVGRHKDAMSQMEMHTYSQEELVAEMGAAYLCGVAGIENVTLDDSASYISHWVQKLKDDRKMLVMAAAQAQKAADYIRGINQEHEKDEDGE